MRANFILDKQARTLTPDKAECLCVGGPCGTGKEAGRKPCPKCAGTGTGPRGGPGGCKECYGSGDRPDFENGITCRSCEGTGIVDSNICDSIAKDRLPELADMIEWRVARGDRPQTWSEAHLGMGCLYSVTDYGDHQKLSDEELLAMVREKFNDDYVQAIKIVDRETFKICDYLVIDCNRNGYSLRAYWGTPERMANLGTFEEAGKAIYHEGGNGTLAAGYLDNLATVPLED